MNWKDIEKHQPNCWEYGNWDGKRSDYVLVFVDGTEMHVARCYGGHLDGSEFLDFYDHRDFEIEGNITHWMNLPSFPN